MTVPTHPKIYHIVHMDRLSSIFSEGCLWSDARLSQLKVSGTNIGMSKIKQRRLAKPLNSHPSLHVGECVPFYVCPRSIMLYLIHQNNHPELSYKGGQEPIIHLQVDLYKVIHWAQNNNHRWAFTTSNAGSAYFEDWNDLRNLHRIDWNAVKATNWQDCKEGKQAEFLLEEQLPWTLIEKIGVYSSTIHNQIVNLLPNNELTPNIAIEQKWYY